MLPSKNRLKLPTKWNRNYPDFQLRNLYFKILVKKTLPNQESKAGFIISSKVGKATVRNKTRRLLESIIKTFLERPLGLEIVFILFPTITKAKDEEIKFSSHQTLSKIPLR